jgi:hypothetical protein
MTIFFQFAPRAHGGKRTPKTEAQLQKKAPRRLPSAPHQRGAIINPTTEKVSLVASVLQRLARLEAGGI